MNTENKIIGLRWINLLSFLFVVFSADLSWSQEQPNEYKQLILQYVSKSLDSCNTRLIQVVNNPSNHNQKLIAVPKIIEYSELEGFTKYRVFLLLVTQDNQLIHKFIDPTAYYSDANQLRSIRFDVANYKLNPETRAFGLRFYYEGSSDANPSESEELNLYYIQNNQILKILDGYSTILGMGENNQEMGDGFESSYTQLTRILIPSTFQSNTFADILVKEKKEIIEFQGDKENTSQIPYQKIGVLTFDKTSKTYNFIEAK